MSAQEWWWKGVALHFWKWRQTLRPTRTQVRWLWLLRGKLRADDVMMRIECVGPDSELAGKVDGCAGCPNQQLCASGEASKPDPGAWIAASCVCLSLYLL